MTPWSGFWSRVPQFCRHHFYKVVILAVLCLLVIQYCLGTKSYLSVTLFYNPKDMVTTSSYESQEAAFMIFPTQNRSFLWLTTTNNTANLTLCPLVPPKLVGPLKVWTEAPSWEELEKLYADVADGGRYRPQECQARHRVAIIIPYRNRDYHLRLFLYNMHPMLRRQQLDYGIFVIEEAGDVAFNRAMLMNIGFVESLKLYDWQCFIFHDVDLLPEDDRNLYSCPEQPRHMSVAVDNLGYKLPYADIFGGVSALTKEHMSKVNGFSNEFWGWGGEDDDMSNRIRHYGYKISRYQPSIARYKMMKHTKEKPNPDRYNKLYKGKLRYKTDGINSLKYSVKQIVLKRLYTWINVELTMPKQR